MLYISITNYGFLATGEIGMSSLILLKIHYLASAHSCVSNKTNINKLGEIMESCIQHFFFFLSRLPSRVIISGDFKLLHYLMDHTGEATIIWSITQNPLFTNMHICGMISSSFSEK